MYSNKSMQNPYFSKVLFLIWTYFLSHYEGLLLGALKSGANCENLSHYLERPPTFFLFGMLNVQQFCPIFVFLNLIQMQLCARNELNQKFSTTHCEWTGLWLIAMNFVYCTTRISNDFPLPFTQVWLPRLRLSNLCLRSCAISYDNLHKCAVGVLIQ